MLRFPLRHGLVWSATSGPLRGARPLVPLVRCVVPTVPCVVPLVPYVVPLVHCAVPTVPSVVPLLPYVVPLVPCAVPLVPCAVPPLPCVVPLVPCVVLGTCDLVVEVQPGEGVAVFLEGVGELQGQQIPRDAIVAAEVDDPGPGLPGCAVEAVHHLPVNQEG